MSQSQQNQFLRSLTIDNASVSQGTEQTSIRRFRDKPISTKKEFNEQEVKEKYEKLRTYINAFDVQIANKFNPDVIE